MKRSTIRLLTMGMAWAMMICGSPQLSTRAMEEQDITAVLPEADGEGEEPGDSRDETLSQKQLLQAARALEQLAAEREIVAVLYRMDQYPLSPTAGYAESGIVDIPSGGQVMIESVELRYI